MILSKIAMFAIGFFAFLVLAATVYRFVIYVKTLHLVEEIQDDVLDNEFIDLLSNKPKAKAIEPSEHGGIYKK